MRSEIAKPIAKPRALIIDRTLLSKNPRYQTHFAQMQNAPLKTMNDEILRAVINPYRPIPKNL
jgi:hypothetical protein